MRNAMAALLLVTAPALLGSCAEGRKEPARMLQPRPAVPVPVNVTDLPEGSHVIYAKDGERLMAQVSPESHHGGTRQGCTEPRHPDSYRQAVDEGWAWLFYRGCRSLECATERICGPRASICAG